MDREGTDREGLIICPSDFGPRETMDKLASAVTLHGIGIMARIDHAGGAAAVGMQLRPTEVLIFGNPRGGTPMMQAAQTIGIDLPLKALVWQDEEGRTWVGYNDPRWQAARHGLSGPGQVLEAMATALAEVTRIAIT